MREIQLIDHTQFDYTVNVDGTEIVLKTAANHIPYKDMDSLGKYIDSLEKKVISGKPLADLRTTIGGTNMLRVLGALFRDDTIKNWKELIGLHPGWTGKELFQAYFGYVHNLTNCPSEFAKELYEISSGHLKAHKYEQQRMRAELEAKERLAKGKIETALSFSEKVSTLEMKNRAMQGDWFVERKHLKNNVVIYSVNGTEIEICLSGRPAFGYAYFVVGFLADLKDALIKHDTDSIRKLIKESGGKAACEIMGQLFHNETLMYFRNEQKRHFYSERVNPVPSSFLKDFFGGTQLTLLQFGNELMSALESDIPAIENDLVASSDDEIHCDKRVWALFYRSVGRVFSVNIVFPDAAPLRHQMQEHYAKVAQSYIDAKKPYAYKIFQDHLAITRFLKHVDDKSITSITDLSVWDVRNAISHMQINSLSVSSIRKSLLLTRKFLSSVDPALARKAIPSKLIMAQPLNPTTPLAPIVFSKLKAYKDQMPVYVWLAFRLYEETGGRASSIFQLTTDDLMRCGDKWVLRIYNFKEYENKTLSGAPSSTPHAISEELGDELIKYIQDTKELREQLEIPYIFVYERVSTREGSKRQPIVLTVDAYYDCMTRLCTKNGIVDAEGSVQIPTTRSIRAEVGRAKFAGGASAKDVANLLGNTEEIAIRHYNKAYPKDYAKKRRDLYAETLDELMEPQPKSESNVLHLNYPLYGTCSENTEKCGNCNECNNCSQRIVRRIKEGV